MLLVTMCIGISAEDAVAKISRTTDGETADVTYTSLTDAINGAQDGETIVVLQNADMPSVINISNKAITIESEDAASVKTVTFSGSQAGGEYFGVAGTAQLTIRNITFTRTNFANYGLFYIKGTGKLTIGEGATIKDVKGGNGGAVHVEESGTCVLDGGTISNSTSSWRTGGAVNIESGSGNFIMNSGTLSGNKGAVSIAKGAKGTINSGTITGTLSNAAVSVVSGASLTISDNVVFKGNASVNVQAVDGANVTVNLEGTSLIRAFAVLPSGGAVTAVTLNNDLNITAAEDGTTEVESGKGYYVYDIRDKKFVIEGNGKNINLSGNVYLRGLGSTAITLKNVTVLRPDYGTFAIFDMKDNSVLNMEDGTTIGSDDFVTSGGNGAAVFLENNSTFNMNGGTIKNCQSASRAAVGVDNGTFNMTGGTITGCNGTSANTPSVLIVTSGTANLTGGEIKDNGTSQAGKGAIILGSWDNKGTGKIVVNGTAITNVGMAPAVYKCSTDAAATLDINADGLTYDETGKAWYEDTTLEKTVAFIGARPFASLSSVFDYANTSANDYTVELTKSFNEDLTTKNTALNARNGGTLTINGNGYTVTVNATTKSGSVASSGWIVISGKLELNDVTFTRDNAADYALFRILSGTLTMNDGAIIEKTRSGNGSAVFVEGSGKLIMNEGSVIQNCTSTWSGTVWMLNANGEITINGGKLINNNGGMGVIVATGGNLYLKGGEFSGNTTSAVVVCKANSASNATVHLSGDIKFTGNTRDIYFNLVEANKDKGTLVLDGDFTGNVKIEGTAYAASLLKDGATAYATAGLAIGTASGTVKSVDSITSADGKLFARVSDGNLVWTVKPTLTMDTDTGKYTIGEDSAEYGVVRVITTAATDADVDVKVFGTYFVKVAGGELTTTNKFEDENGTFTDGSGYIADLVDITEDAKVYAISYYTIDGIEDMVKTDAAVIEYVAATAKDLGSDPEDLNY